MIDNQVAIVSNYATVAIIEADKDDNAE